MAPKLIRLGGPKGPPPRIMTRSRTRALEALGEEADEEEVEEGDQEGEDGNAEFEDGDLEDGEFNETGPGDLQDEEIEDGEDEEVDDQQLENDQLEDEPVDDEEQTEQESSSSEEEEPSQPPFPLNFENLTQKELRQRDAALKDSSASNPPRWPGNVTWHHEPHHLGGGGGGQAFLWLGVDRNRKILRRMVVKDCYVTAHQWGNVNHWYGDPRDVENRMHMEIKIHQVLRGRQGQEHCAEMLHSEVKDRRMFYRLYLTFYPHGDLGHLFKEYKEPPKRPPGRKGKRQKEEPPEDFVPEPFLWSLLETLTEACLLLESGAVEEDEAIADWESIVHRDIKPGNIFLDTPRDDIYPSYPHPILSDFGIAVMTSDDDPLNPNFYNALDGTQGWMPPEMMPMVDKETWQPARVSKLGAKTNVWGIGGIVITLMNKDKLLFEVKKKEFTQGVAEQPVINASAINKYSEQLVRLVRQCTSYWPRDRPDLRALRRRIRRRTGNGRHEDLARGMRREGHDDGDEELELRYPRRDPCEVGKFAREALEEL